MANFYGEKSEVTFEGVTYSSLAIINKEELLGEWKVFKRALFQENKIMMGEKLPSIFARHKKNTMETSYACIFPESLKMMNIFLVLLIGTASVERSFSCLKMIKTWLRSRLSDCSVRVSIEGPKIDAVEFEEILEICKENNHRILL